MGRPAGAPPRPPLAHARCHDEFLIARCETSRDRGTHEGWRTSSISRQSGRMEHDPAISQRLSLRTGWIFIERVHDVAHEAHHVVRLLLLF